LGRAVAQLPDRARVRYNHALALQHLGKRERAESALLAALEAAPGDLAIRQALVIFYLQDERFDRASKHARNLASRFPEERSVQELLRQIEARRRRHEQALGRRGPPAP